MRLSRRELLGGAALAAGASLAPHLAWAATRPLPGIVADPTIAGAPALRASFILDAIDKAVACPLCGPELVRAGLAAEAARRG